MSSNSTNGALSKAAALISDAKVISALILAMISIVFYAGYQYNEFEKKIAPWLGDGNVISINTTWGQDLSTPVSGIGGIISVAGQAVWNEAICPNGHYMVGIQGFGAPGGYCQGCASRIKLVCRPIEGIVVKPTSN